MRNLIKKELSLCLHPAAVLFIFLGAFVCIPNYPYEVMFFFNGLGVFFICLTARENGDLAFSCTLPVKKEKIAYARIALCVGLQLCQLAFAGVCTALKCNLFPQANYAGMDANLALFGLGFLMLGIFNAVYFPLYFANPNAVGKPFVICSVLEFFVVLLDIVLCYALPVYGQLDVVGLQNLGAQLVFFAVGFLLYLGGTAFSFFRSGKNFAKFDS